MSDNFRMKARAPLANTHEAENITNSEQTKDSASLNKSKHLQNKEENVTSNLESIDNKNVEYFQDDYETPKANNPKQIYTSNLPGNKKQTSDTENGINSGDTPAAPEEQVKKPCSENFVSNSRVSFI